MIVKSLSHVRLFATLWTTAYQAPLSMRFSKQEYWSGLPFGNIQMYQICNMQYLNISNHILHLKLTKLYMSIMSKLKPASRQKKILGLSSHLSEQMSPQSVNMVNTFS